MNKEIDVKIYIARTQKALRDLQLKAKAGQKIKKSIGNLNSRVTDRDEPQTYRPNVAEALKNARTCGNTQQQAYSGVTSNPHNPYNNYTCARITESSCAKISCPMCHWNDVVVEYRRQNLRVAQCRVCGHAWEVK